MGLEARIPCPACGGPIHPVAGRCKHCKADLVARRTGKPQAASALPALGNRTTNERGVASPRGLGIRGRLPAVDPTTATFGMGSPLPSAALPPVAIPIPVAPAWPVIVIALSAIAIVLAVGVLATQLR